MASKHGRRKIRRTRQTPAQPVDPISEPKTPVSHSRSWRGVVMGLGILIGLWLVLFSALPPTVLRGVLENQISEALNAPVVLDKVEVNPFTLEISVQGIRVPYLMRPESEDENLPTPETKTMTDAPEQAGDAVAAHDALLTIDELCIVPELRSLFRSGPIRAAVRIERPVLHITYLGNGAFSFSSLLPALRGETQNLSAEQTNPASPANPAESESDGWEMFTVSDLQLLDGTIVLRDKPLNMTHTVNDIQLFVPLGEAQDGDNTARIPTLSALVNGSRIDIQGLILPETTVVRTEFRLQVASFSMEHFRRYLESFTPVRLDKGTAELDLVLTLAQPQDDKVSIALSGTIRAADVEITSPAGGVVGRLKRGEIRLEEFTLDKRLVVLQGVELDGLFLRASRDASGRIDWEIWLRDVLEAQPRNSTPQGAQSGILDRSSNPQPQRQTETPFIIEGADLVLRNADFVWADAAFAAGRQIAITGVDGRIAQYSTRPGAKTAMRLSFGINTEGVLALEGEGTLNPPSLDATLMVDDLPLVVLRPLLGSTPLQDVLGRIDLKGHFRMEDEATGQTAANVRMAIDNGEAAIRAFSFGRGNSVAASSVQEGKPAVRVQSCNFKGLELDTRARLFSLKTLGVVAPELRIVDAVDGLELAVPGRKVASASPAKSSPLSDVRLTQKLEQTLVAALDGWKVRIEAFRLDKGKLSRESVQAGTSGKKGDTSQVLISNLHLETGALSSDLRKTVSFRLRSEGVRSDILTLEGTVRPVPFAFSSRVTAQDLWLDSLDVFARPVTDVSSEGRLRADMDIGVTEKGNQLAIQISGNLTLRDALFRDVRTGTRLGRLRRCTVEKIRFSSSDRTFEAGDVLLDRPRLELVRDSKGDLELFQVVRKRRAPQVEASDLTFSRFSIGAVRIQDGGVFFQDQSVTPSTNTVLRGLEGTIGAFSSSSPSGLAAVDFSAQLDGAPLKLRGQANPSASPPAAKLVLTVTGLDLVRYSAYARHYLGYPVEQGRLNLESQIETQNWAFSADNAIRMDKLVLGRRDPASGAPEYPLTLGLALLEDRSGTVSVNVPIRGTLNDSTLRVGGLVGSALGGLFTKILTSPFSLVGGLFGFMADNPELHVVAFGAGQSRLNASSQKTLKALVQLLQQRPKLRLGLVGMYEPGSDTQGLLRMKVRRTVQALKYAEFSRAQQATTSVDRVTFAPGEYETLLFRVYRDAPGVDKKRDRAGAVTVEEPDIMERKLQARNTVSDVELQSLARERAEAVRAFILATDPKLAPRVSLMEKKGVPLVREGASQVELQLR